ncbi:hypothetical protein IKU74_00180 [bacterium]|nr:hypothetical protein [bacterium]
MNIKKILLLIIVGIIVLTLFLFGAYTYTQGHFKKISFDNKNIFRINKIYKFNDKLVLLDYQNNIYYLLIKQNKAFVEKYPYPTAELMVEEPIRKKFSTKNPLTQNIKIDNDKIFFSNLDAERNANAKFYLLNINDGKIKQYPSPNELKKAFNQPKIFNFNNSTLLIYISSSNPSDKKIHLLDLKNDKLTTPNSAEPDILANFNRDSIAINLTNNQFLLLQQHKDEKSYLFDNNNYYLKEIKLPITVADSSMWSKYFKIIPTGVAKFLLIEYSKSDDINYITTSTYKNDKITHITTHKFPNLKFPLHTATFAKLNDNEYLIIGGLRGIPGLTLRYINNAYILNTQTMKLKRIMNLRQVFSNPEIIVINENKALILEQKTDGYEHTIGIFERSKL